MASRTTSGKTVSTNVYLNELNTREWGNYLHMKYPEFSLVTLFGVLGYEDYITQHEFSHWEMDRTRDTGIIGATGTGTGTDDVAWSGITATIRTTATTLFFIPYDIIRLPNGRLAHVDACAVTDGFQALTIRSLDAASNFVIADFGGSGATNSVITQLYNMAGECFTAPLARTHQPEKISNRVTKIPKRSAICDDEYNRTKEISLNGQNYWWFLQQDIDMKEHKKDVEMSVLLGETAVLASGGNSETGAASGGYGVIPYVSQEGYRATFTSGGLLEQDLIDWGVDMAVYSRSNEWLVLCGDIFMRQATTEMRDYHVSGGVQYGAFKDKNTFGLTLGQYKFNDKLMNFLEYKPFSDPNLLPAPTAGINYREFALALNLGTDEHGDPLVCLKYLVNPQNKPYKMFKTYYPGNIFSDVVEGNNYVVSNDKACLEEFLTTTVGVEMRGAGNHGMIYGA